IDDVVGVLNIKDFFRLRNADRDTIIREAVKQAYFVPEGIHADVLFRQMKDTKQHFAVVLDEYGGMMGIVTMNDLLQQLVGDLADMETAEQVEPEIEQIDENTWEIQGIAPLGDVAEALGIELPVEKYDTFGGYVFSNYGIVPEDGTEFELELEPLHIKVTEIRDHRIEKMTVVLTLPEPEDDDDDEDDDDEDEEEFEGEIQFIHYELDCPECGGAVVLDEETIQQGVITCPHCNKKLEIDLGFEGEEVEQE
ncbi:MAG: CBS domain-containing protein, partial [Oscillospiraceae bacterium]|nr:CBS domain-containing protein [Oscillospiraceae bacterium]